MDREALLDELSEKLGRWPVAVNAVLTEGWIFQDGKYSHPNHGQITIDDWNRAKIKPKTVVKIINKDHRDLVKRYMAELGHRYWGSYHESDLYRHVDEAGDVVPLSIKCDDYKEIFIEMPKEKNNSSVSVGVTYHSSEGEALTAEEIEAIYYGASSFSCNPTKTLSLSDEALENIKNANELIFGKDSSAPKHNHYFKDVSNLDFIDVYRVCDLFEVKDDSGAMQHAIKKLLCSGKRGVKGEKKDIQEAIDTLVRKLEMMNEDEENKL